MLACFPRFHFCYTVSMTGSLVQVRHDRSFQGCNYRGEGAVNPRFDIWPRPLGEHAWFSVPIIGELMYSIGAVDGTRRNCP